MFGFCRYSIMHNLASCFASIGLSNISDVRRSIRVHMLPVCFPVEVFWGGVAFGGVGGGDYGVRSFRRSWKGWCRTSLR
jgi:hypothetical protein